MEFEKKVEYLYKSIEDNQNTIRFTDTKAGAILLLIGIVLTFITSFYSKLKELICSIDNQFFHSILIIIFILSLLLLFISFLLVFLSLIPKSNPFKGIKNNDDNQINLLYLSEIEPTINICNIFNDSDGYFKLKYKIEDLIDNLNKLNEEELIKILIVETQKVSFIRELKIKRVKFSLTYIKWSFILLFILSIVFIIYDLIK